MLELDKNGKLVDLGEENQKKINKFLKNGGIKIKYDSESFSFPALVVIKGPTSGNEIVGWLVGEDALIINELVHLSKNYPDGMKLSEFIKNYCPDLHKPGYV